MGILTIGLKMSPQLLRRASESVVICLEVFQLINWAWAQKKSKRDCRLDTSFCLIAAQKILRLLSGPLYVYTLTLYKWLFLAKASKTWLEGCYVAYHRT